jgi:adenine deaminase
MWNLISEDYSTINMKMIRGQYVDIFQRRVYPATITFENGRIAAIDPAPPTTTQEENAELYPGYILPGFIDAHVHIESSMLVPSEFARLAVVHGTVATVSDPHEIGNVCGLEGVEFMIENGKEVPFKFYFGAPSCVHATSFETAGAVIDAKDVSMLLGREEIKYLSEMMNFPGVLSRDADVMMKIDTARKAGKPIDGHAPGLRGLQAKHYAQAGISTDHECFTREEAFEKLEYGMMILIREGSAAKNFDALIDLLHDFPTKIMFCSDDKHPDSLQSGHINALCERAISKGVDVFKVLQAACINPIEHYKIDVGYLRPNDPADFIVVEDLKHFKVWQTYIRGELVAENGYSKIESVAIAPINNFNCAKKQPSDFVSKIDQWPAYHISKNPFLPVIEALEGQLITNKLSWKPKIKEGVVVTDPDNDILKIAVVNRYHDSAVATAFIKNFGLKDGALASSVAHDSHNIVAVGTNDEDICKAVNMIIDRKGGISCVTNSGDLILPLPVAGLMSTDDGYFVAKRYIEIDAMAKSLHCSLISPFMTLSFMALLVIPHLKLSDKGLFDGDSFQLIS